VDYVAILAILVMVVSLNSFRTIPKKWHDPWWLVAALVVTALPLPGFVLALNQLGVF
jgi:EamA domain-containing membrane protein RarD